MPDQPRDERGQEPGDQRDYGWLYGGTPPPPTQQPNQKPARQPTQQPPSAADPEPTRVMPALSRPGRPGGSSSPQEAPAPPRRDVRPAQPVAPPPRSPRPARSRRVPVRRLVLLVLLAWILFLVGVPLWAWSTISKVDAAPAGGRPGDQPGTTYLLVGSDSRAGLTAAEKRRLSVGGVSASGQRTDSIMLLHVGSGPTLLLSVPRDSLVEIPGRGVGKINSAFAIGGPRLLVRTLEQNTGIRIDDYVEIGFGGFVNTVDAVGGITICPANNLRDRRSGLNIKKGCQEVDGATALAFSRNRYSYKGLGDVQRATNQRKVVAAIGSKVKSPWTVLNPLRYLNLNRAAATSVRISEGTGPIALTRFALAMASGGRTCTVPIRDLAVNWDEQRSEALFKRVREDRTAGLGKDLCSPSGLGR